MAARRIDGKALAKQLRAAVAKDAADFTERHGRPPGLHVVLVGEDPASVIYTRNKEKAAAKVGIAGKLHKLPIDVSEAALLEQVAALNAEESVDGLLVQLPLPDHIDPDRVVDAISPSKDVDGFHPMNTGLLSTGRPGLVACTPRGIMHLIDQTDLDLRGAQAVIIGRSNIVGKPMAQLLLAQHATVTLCHSRTRDLPAVSRQADLLVVAVGQAHMVQRDWVKQGAVVIDVGTNRLESKKLVGDVDTEAVMDQAGWITPVPGGVGPMTITCLLENTVIAARRRLGETDA